MTQINTIKLTALSLNTTLIGELEDELALFRGIPYASVNQRWTHSKVRNSLPSPFDATEFGPRCVQTEGQVLVSGGVNDPTPGDDEFNCLNLNVTVPVDYLREGPNLPVMFWIHGGAFNYGANSVGRYRPQKLSSLAKQAGTPVVLVQTQYRLGALGFAASKDLGERAGNYGFVDQQNALEWVRNHIAGFGGDPNNVTAFGISAGSASVHYHILTGSPLFDRAIMMSGSAPTLGPLPFEMYERAWKRVCDAKGIAEDRVAKLRALSPMELLQSYTDEAMGPVADETLFTVLWKPGQEHPPSRCKSIILGDTHTEAIILDGLIKNVQQSKFHERVKSTFSCQAQPFLDSFGFTSSDLPYEEYRKAMRHFLSVAMFQYPNFAIAQTYNQAGSAYLYHFEEPSPYFGPTHGIAYHGQCALFMYMNETDTYPESAKQVATEMAHTWTAFANGKQPWEKYSVGKRFMRFGPNGGSQLTDVENDEARDYTYLPWLSEHWEEFKVFAQSFLHR